MVVRTDEIPMRVIARILGWTVSVLFDFSGNGVCHVAHSRNGRPLESRLQGICFRVRRTGNGKPAIPGWRGESCEWREFSCFHFLQFQQARQSQSPTPQHHQSAAVEGLDERRKDFSTFCRSPATRLECTRPSLHPSRISFVWK